MNRARLPELPDRRQNELKFHCPSCRQSCEFPVSDKLRDELKRADPAEHERIFAEMIEDGKNEFVNGDFPLDICVKCPLCQKRLPLVNWFMAGIEPLMFFDTEELCRCGGEFWLEIASGLQTVSRCDRCGQIRPN